MVLVVLEEYLVLSFESLVQEGFIVTFQFSFLACQCLGDDVFELSSCQQFFSQFLRRCAVASVFFLSRSFEHFFWKKKLRGVGFEPTRLTPSELESDPLDRSGIRAVAPSWDRTRVGWIKASCPNR